NCGQKTKTEIMDLLVDRLGKPKNELDNNCLDAVAKKVLYFYGEEKETKSKAISSMVGQVVEITQRTFGPENKRRLLDQNLLFKYRNSIFGKDICDFYPVGSESAEPISQPQPQNDKGTAAPDSDGENQ
ncbi:6004_t:CDS:2, partial [Ambispora leptoticha]